MAKNAIKTMVILSFVVLVSACSSVKVTTDYDKTVDFRKFKTFEYFGWAEKSDKILNRFDKERIEKAFGEEFKKRGLQYVKSNGDLMVTLYVVTEQKTRTNVHTTTTGMGYAYGGYYGYGPRYRWGPSMGMGYSTTTYSDYVVGTLVIDIYDAKAKQLIWESVGTKTVDDNPNTRDENISKAVAAIMKPYPVAPIKGK